MRNKKIVYIMRGIPGSGKSTLAKSMASKGGNIVSADDYFVVDGVYRFDASKLSEAHSSCMRRAIEHVQSKVETPLFVDNTNIHNVEIAPYVLLAQSFGYTPKILTLYTEDVSFARRCAERNTHGVPIEKVMVMYERLRLELPKTPPWWDQQILTPKEVA
jgi:tRNA uridine 5-carbamoylmethylation protein Kti12